MSCQLRHRIDPEQYMARFYRLEVLTDLFGEFGVERVLRHEGGGRRNGRKVAVCSAAWLQPQSGKSVVHAACGEISADHP